jgi:hypothetical protein
MAGMALVAGCSGGSSPLPTTDHPTEPRSSRPMTQAEVDESITTVAELPRGFVADPKAQATDILVKGSADTVDPTRCTPALRAELNFNILGAAFAKGHADFTDGKSRLVGMTIYSFQSPYPVGNLTDDLARAVHDCPNFKYPDTPEATTTVHTFTTPGLGDESIGMHFRTTSTAPSEPPVDIGVEITRVGMFDVLSTTEYVQDGRLDTGLLASLTRAAVGRML